MKFWITSFITFALTACTTTGGSHPESPPVTRTQIMKTTTTWDGRPINVAAIPEGTQAELVGTVFELAAHTKLPFHCHTYPVFGLLLEGRLQVETLTGETKLFKAGDAVSELQGRWHRGMTLDTPARFVAFDLMAEGGIDGRGGNMTPMTDENRGVCVE